MTGSWQAVRACRRLLAHDGLPPFAERQGHYLASIHAYSGVCGQPPAKRDVERSFRVSAPSVHRMFLTLERLGLIGPTADTARSVHVLLAPE